MLNFQRLSSVPELEAKERWTDWEKQEIFLQRLRRTEGKF